MHNPRSQISYANVMATVAVFLALGGGAYAAITLPKNSVGSKQLKAHAVTPSKVARATLSLFKGQTGPPGPPGERGIQGQPGPGATTFAMSLSKPTVLTDLQKLPNDITVAGACGASDLGIDIEDTNSTPQMQASGITNADGTLAAVDADSGNIANNEGVHNVDFDVLVRDASGGPFEHLIVHGTYGASSCDFWGMVTPSS